MGLRAEYPSVVIDQQRKVRRTPRFTAFLATGGVVGLLIGVIAGVVGHTDSRYDTAAALGFLGLVCASLGVLAGGLVAVLLDKRR
jgi:ethanolamine transporter EutH